MEAVAPKGMNIRELRQRVVLANVRVAVMTSRSNVDDKRLKRLLRDVDAIRAHSREALILVAWGFAYAGIRETVQGRPDPGEQPALQSPDRRSMARVIYDLIWIDVPGWLIWFQLTLKHD